MRVENVTWTAASEGTCIKEALIAGIKRSDIPAGPMIASHELNLVCINKGVGEEACKYVAECSFNFSRGSDPNLLLPAGETDGACQQG